MLKLGPSALATFLFVAAAAAPSLVAAQNTSQVFGRVADESGAVLPGVTVSLSSPALLEPRVAVTSETGTYEFSGLPIGVYSVKFELAGFSSLVREGLQLQSGFNAQVNGELSVGGLQENVVVTGVNPIVDVRSTTQGTRFNVEELQAIPSARDVFQILTQTPGIAGDRQNVGGTHNGQQTGMFSRGAGSGQGRWFVDGVDRNDLANGRPFVIDFNSVEEVQVSTGGADVTMQTPGVFVAVVTKSGSDAYHGASWLLRTDRHLGSTNVTDEQRAQGANSGNPLVYTNDYGGQLGGPIKKGRAWFWGTYGMQNVRLGVLNVYKQTTECAPVQANPLAYSFSDVIGCLVLNKQDVPALGSKFNVRPFCGQPLHRRQFVRPARRDHPQRRRPPSDASRRRTRWRTCSRATARTTLAPPGWNTGIWDPSWKFGDQHTFSDRWLVDVSFGHHCWCNSIVPQTLDLRQQQPMLELTTGTWGRSWSDSTIMLVTNNTLDATSSYFLPGKWGGDHSLKARLQVRPLRRGVRPHLQRTCAGGVQQRAPAADLQHAVHGARDPRLHHAGLLRPALDVHSGHVLSASGSRRSSAFVGIGRRTTSLRRIFRRTRSRDSRRSTARRSTCSPRSTCRRSRAGVVWNTVAPRVGAHLRSHRQRHERDQGFVRDLLRSAHRRSAVQVAQPGGLGPHRSRVDRSERRPDRPAERDQPEPDPLGHRLRSGQPGDCSSAPTASTRT